MYVHIIYSHTLRKVDRNKNIVIVIAILPPSRGCVTVTALMAVLSGEDTKTQTAGGAAGYARLQLLPRGVIQYTVGGATCDV